jgi:hypothetical protein
MSETTMKQDFVGDTPVIHVCSCLRLSLTYYNQSGAMGIEQGWEKSETPPWDYSCGRKAHSGLGRLMGEVIRDFLQDTEWAKLPTKRLADLLYCAVRGWGDLYYFAGHWYAEPPESEIPLPAGDSFPSRVKVPYLTSPNFDPEDWMKKNALKKLELSPDNAQSMAMDLAQMNELIVTLIGEEAGFTGAHKKAMLATELNTLALSASAALGKMNPAVFDASPGPRAQS